MKFYISADIEGVTDVTSGLETRIGEAEFKEAAYQMSLEVDAACKGLNNIGANEIVVKDAHATGRNISHRLLPRNAKLIRSWSGSAFSMMQEIDETYDGVLFIGYHSAVTSGESPLAHTINGGVLEYIKLNNEIMSEFRLNSYMASYYNVPVLFLSGDKGICDEAKALNANMHTVAVKEGKGNSTINIHPDLALEMIEKEVEKSVEGELSNRVIPLPEEFELEIRYKSHGVLEEYTNYPGTEKLDSKTLKYKSNDFMDIIKALRFLI